MSHGRAKAAATCTKRKPEQPRKTLEVKAKLELIGTPRIKKVRDLLKELSNK